LLRLLVSVVGLNAMDPAGVPEVNKRRTTYPPQRREATGTRQQQHQNLQKRLTEHGQIVRQCAKQAPNNSVFY
jgi:hypothetical protein